MLFEKAEITVKPGAEAEFHSTIVARGVPLLAGFPGVKSVKFGRGVENPEKFMFLVEWESLEAHAAFNAHPTRMEFVGLFAPHAQGGTMEHFELD